MAVSEESKESPKIEAETGFGTGLRGKLKKRQEPAAPETNGATPPPEDEQPQPEADTQPAAERPAEPEAESEPPAHEPTDHRLPLQRMCGITVGLPSADALSRPSQAAPTQPGVPSAPPWRPTSPTSETIESWSNGAVGSMSQRQL